MAAICCSCFGPETPYAAPQAVQGRPTSRPTSIRFAEYFKIVCVFVDIALNIWTVRKTCKPTDAAAVLMWFNCLLTIARITPGVLGLLFSDLFPGACKKNDDGSAPDWIWQRVTGRARLVFDTMMVGLTLVSITVSAIAFHEMIKNGWYSSGHNHDAIRGSLAALIFDGALVVNDVHMWYLDLVKLERERFDDLNAEVAKLQTHIEAGTRQGTSFKDKHTYEMYRCEVLHAHHAKAHAGCINEPAESRQLPLNQPTTYEVFYNLARHNSQLLETHHNDAHSPCVSFPARPRHR